MSDAHESRRAEFATARHCAHTALAQLGAPPAPILRGVKHEPLWPDGVVGSITHCRGYRAAAVACWPDGVVGSITHCRGYRAAAVAFREAVITLGIDAEPHAPLPAGVARRVLGDEERHWLEGAPEGAHWDRVIFSAKDSIYKAWFPLTGRWLGFDDAVITIDAEGGCFWARLLVDGPAPLRKLTGRFLIEDALVLTAIALQA
jgi:4'-phosphopantetheinyl transferase EntD